MNTSGRHFPKDVILTTIRWYLRYNLSYRDIEELREVGFKDRAILDINQIVAYYAFVNRIADGLGVDLEEFWNNK